MSHSNRSSQSDLRVVADTLAWIAVIILAIYLFSDLLIGVASDRSAIQQAAEAGCAKGEAKACFGSYADARAANAAEQIVDLTAIQFLAGIVGVVLVGLTLRATREAVREANDATNAAKEALRITRESSERQLRAYVHFQAADLNNLLPDQVPKLTIQVRNAGQTPAYRVRAYVVYTILRVDIHNTYRPSGMVFRGESSMIDQTINPNEAFGLQKHLVFSLPAESIAAVRDGRFAFVAAVYLKYVDGFGKLRRTTGLYFTPHQAFKDEQPGWVQMASCRRGNRST